MNKRVKDYKVVGIDEAQFFDDGIVEESVAEPPIIFIIKSLAFNDEVVVFDP